jgi:hypothetical protein
MAAYDRLWFALMAALITPVPCSATNFDAIRISKADSDHEWPFSIESGDLFCGIEGGQKEVVFMEPWQPSGATEFESVDKIIESGGFDDSPRVAIVSTNPLRLVRTDNSASLYAPFDNLETLIKRLAPFETLGRNICPEPMPDKVN